MDRINLLKTIAVIMVFFLHASLFDGGNFKAGQLFLENGWTFIFKTPAWAGCWIFFCISGFLAAKGYLGGKYCTERYSVLQYYKSKVTKIWVPTIFFWFVCILFSYPDFIINNKNVLFQLISCTYNGNPGLPGIGATWFVFTVMWLYFLTPLFFILIQFFSKKKKNIVLLIITLGLGFAYRYYCYKSHLDWYRFVYTIPLANIDLYISGMLAAFMNYEHEVKSSRLNDYCIIFLIGFVLFNSYTYYSNLMIPAYMYRFQSVYLLLVFLSLMTIPRGIKNKTILGKIIDYVAMISFEFYLFHSLVLYKIAPYVYAKNGTLGYLKLVVITVVITLFSSLLFKRIAYNK